MVLMIYVFVFLQLPGFAFICRFWCSFVSPQFPSLFNFERKFFERLGIWFAATVSLRWPCWRPSRVHVWWLSWCIVPFCHECGLPLVFISWFWCHFVSFGIHLGFIWSPFGRHWASKWSSKTIWGPKWSQKALRSEKCEFPIVYGARIPTSNFIFFQLCTEVPWFFWHMICRCDFFVIFIDTWTPEKREIMQNHRRVSQNQGFAHSEKEKFQVTI